MQLPNNRGDGQDSGMHPAVTAPTDVRTTQGTRPGNAVTHEFHNFVADIEDLIKSTTSLTGEDLERARQKLALRISKAKDSIEKVSASVSTRVRDGAKLTDGYVHDSPWQAIGLGGLAGLLLGVLIARRSH